MLMPKAKLSPTLPLALAFASLIVISGHLEAAPDGTAKKQATAQQAATKKAAPKPHAASKPAAVARGSVKATTSTKATAKTHPAGNASARSARSAGAAKAAKPGKKGATPHVASVPATGAPLPRPRPDAAGSQPMVLASADSQPAFAKPSIAAPITTTTSQGDVAATRQALDLIRRGKISEASEVKKSITDPAALKLIEWVYLRSPHSTAGFERYAAFVRDNPTWPSTGLLQRRAEGSLWDDKRDITTIRAFFMGNQPKSGKGRLALARAMLAQGDRAAAQRLVRETWRRDILGADAEQDVLEQFGGLLTAADHQARMHRMIFAEEEGAALRAARRLGEGATALAKARLALNEKSSKAGALLDAVPAEARNDPNYGFARIQWLRRQDKIAEAGQLMLTMPRDPNQLHDVDEWWVERRLLARKLLDIGDARTAFLVARDAAPPEKENNFVDQHFTAGWIALRFLNDPRTALAHFARIPEGATHPTSLARASYWQGRALEALGRTSEARTHYQAAARVPTAYYGQIARAKLGLSDIGIGQPPALSAAERAALRNVDVVRAVDLLYAANERDLVVTFVADLADKAADMGPLLVAAEICAQQRDARAMLYLGKDAIARGLPFAHVAFPTVGIPPYPTLGPEIDRSIVYAIARQESAFNQRVVSSAKAMGLMQVTAEAGRHTAKRFGGTFNLKRLLSDPVYNVQMGAAELAGLIDDYRGSYILTFAGYNAGRGRIKDWVERYGDPRDPNVDPIDWVERIPFSETRNYVQRIMENMQVYRVHMGRGNRLMIEADLHRGSRSN
jgi:soluble lytic murein transglycosylase